MINLGKETVSQNFPTTIAFDIKILIQYKTSLIEKGI